MGGGGMERVKEGEYGRSTLYICIYENKTVKPVKIVPRRKRRG
jgi:hypothetical protein